MDKSYSGFKCNFKIMAFLFVLIISACAVCGCDRKDIGEIKNSDGVNTEDSSEAGITTYDLDKVISAVSKFPEMSGIEYVKKDEDAENELLIYTLGLEESKFIEKISDYIIGAADDRSNSSFSVLIFKEDADDSIFIEAETVIKQYYVDRLVSLAKVYSPEEAEKAEKAEFIRRGNRLYLVISDENKENIVNECENAIK